MIRYEWRTTLDDIDAHQLRDLLTRAAAYDAEPEYNTIDPDDVVRDMAADGARHLIIWMLPRPVTLGGPDEPERLAGIIRLVPRGHGAADGTIVIDPDLRSIGIVTLLMEREGVDADGPDGWLGSGFSSIRAWARGNHPASGRVGDRNLLPRTRRVWKLVRPSVECEPGDSARVSALTENDAAASTRLLESVGASGVEAERFAGGFAQNVGRHALGVRSGAGLAGLVDLDLTAVFVEDFGKCATVAYVGADPTLDDAATRKVLSDLLIGAGAHADAAGLDGVIAYAESTDDALVAVSRRTGFQHDRTDVLYEIR